MIGRTIIRPTYRLSVLEVELEITSSIRSLSRIGLIEPDEARRQDRHEDDRDLAAVRPEEGDDPPRPSCARRSLGTGRKSARPNGPRQPPPAPPRPPTRPRPARHAGSAAATTMVERRDGMRAGEQVADEPEREGRAVAAPGPGEVADGRSAGRRRNRPRRGPRGWPPDRCRRRRAGGRRAAVALTRGWSRRRGPVGQAEVGGDERMAAVDGRHHQCAARTQPAAHVGQRRRRGRRSAPR